MNKSIFKRFVISIYKMCIISKKSFIVLILVLYFYSLLNSQTTFNIAPKIMGLISAEGSVVVYKDTILVTGHGVDHNLFNYYAAFFAKFDMQGNLIKRYTDTEGPGTYYFYNFLHKAYISEDKLITAVEMAKSPFARGYVMVIDIKSGNIDKKIEFFNDRDPGGFHSASGFVKLDSVTYATVTSISENKNTDFVSPQISIINIDTEEVKYIQLGKDGIDDVPVSIFWDGKKFLIGTSTIHPHYIITQPNKKYVSFGRIYEVYKSGLWNEVFVTDSMRAYIRNISSVDDGGFICTSRRIKHHQIPFTNEYIWHAHHIVFKLDSNYNLLWEKPWGLDLEFKNTARDTELILDQDGDGYIVAGYQPNYPWNITSEGKDSMRQEGISPMVVGIMQKVSTEGDSIWMRSFNYVNDTSDYGQKHYISDVTYSPDGGYILYGHVTYSGREGDTIWNAPAWLLKVDKYGCLVPGCQDSTDTINTVEILDDIQVMLYPNPTSDNLLVYQQDGGITNYTITDIIGNKINQWAGDLPNHTYIIDVSSYKSGIYILNVNKGQGKFTSKKFVVE